MNTLNKKIILFKQHKHHIKIAAQCCHYQHTRELISSQNTQHKYNNKDIAAITSRGLY